MGSSLLGNSGTANQDIDENHATFVLESVSVDGTGTEFVVSSDPGDPTLNMPSDNIGAGPIAAAGDCYLVGRLRGRVGGDATPLARGGAGAEPYVVVNEGALGISTTGGGGGGGGAVESGTDGLSDGPPSDPLVDQKGGSGGISLDESPGAPAGQGSVRGTAMVLSDTELELLTQTAGRDLSELTGTALVGSLLMPNAPNDGWMFEISAFDGSNFTVERIQLDDIDIGLLDGPGFDGPGLQVGGTYDFLVLPRLDCRRRGRRRDGRVGHRHGQQRLHRAAAAGARRGRRRGRRQPHARHGRQAGDRPGGAHPREGRRGRHGVRRADAVRRRRRRRRRQPRAARRPWPRGVPGRAGRVAGGTGGGVVGTGQGGAGGTGFARFEDFDDTVNLESLAGIVTPAAAEDNIGRQLGLPQGLGQSLFYMAPVVNPEWDLVQVAYVADTDDDDVAEACSWGFDDTGADGGAQGFLDPPVHLTFNSVPTDESGFFDNSKVNNSFYEACDLVSARAGLAFDAVHGVLLYAPGEVCSRVHRLDPVTLAPTTLGPSIILLPTIPSAATNVIDIVSLGVDTVHSELFLLERVTRRVHVLDLDTGDFKRTITLPLDLQGAMTYDATDDLLLFADNAADRIVSSCRATRRRAIRRAPTTRRSSRSRSSSSAATARRCRSTSWAWRTMRPAPRCGARTACPARCSRSAWRPASRASR